MAKKMLQNGDLVVYKMGTCAAEYAVVQLINSVPHLEFRDGPLIPINMYDPNNLRVLAPRDILEEVKK